VIHLADVEYEHLADGTVYRMTFVDEEDYGPLYDDRPRPWYMRLWWWLCSRSS